MHQVPPRMDSTSGGGNGEVDGGPGAGAALDRQLAAGARDQAAALRDAEAGAALSRREERRADALERLLRHAGPVIGDGKTQCVLAGLDVDQGAPPALIAREQRL